MEKIKLTQDHINVIQDLLHGNLGLDATPYQQKYICEVIDMADELLGERADDFDGWEYTVKWLWEEYQKQEKGK